MYSIHCYNKFVYIVGAVICALLYNYIHGWSTLLCIVRTHRHILLEQLSVRFYTLLVRNSINCWNTNFHAKRKLIFIHLTTNLYALSAPKTFLHCSDVPSLAIFQIFEKMRSSPCSVHCSHVNYTPPVVGSMMLVEAITIVSGGMSISRRGFYAATKLIFIHTTTKFMQRRRKKLFYVS
jgi:hypothetical protein